MTKVNIGFIGTGYRSSIYINLMKTLNLFNITGLCDLNEHSLNTFKNEFIKDEKCFTTTNLEDFINNSNIDIYFICTPDNTHKYIALECLKKGKHIVLEKPIATTHDDCMEIYNQYKLNKNIHIFIPFVLKYTKIFNNIKNLISENAIGKIHFMKYSMILSKLHMGAYHRRWHKSSSLSGGLINTKGCHDIDMICWLLNEKIIKIKSEGSLKTLTERNKPVNASTNCKTCIYNNVCEFRYSNKYVYENALDIENLDKCVYNEKLKDLVDYQKTTFELTNDIKCEYIIDIDNHGTRILEIKGENGKILCDTHKRYIKILDNDGNIINEQILESFTDFKDIHDGGDINFLKEIYNSFITNNFIDIKEEIDHNIYSLLSEKSRLLDKIIEL